MQRKARHSFWLLAPLVSLLTLGAGPQKERAEPADGHPVYLPDAALLALSDQNLPTYTTLDAG